MEKLSGINCVLSTDSMCKKVSFLGNITVSLDPSRERERLGGYEIFRWEYFWQNYTRHRFWLRRKREREREIHARRNSREY